MQRFAYTIKDENGLHARAAGLMAKTAQKLSSEITLETKGERTSLHKLFALMDLDIKQGDEITITVNGTDEDEAVSVLKALLHKNF